jgi:hypothetical protein
LFYHPISFNNSNSSSTILYLSIKQTLTMKFTTALPILALLALTTALPLSRRHASPQDADLVSELLAEEAAAEHDNSELAAAQLLAELSSQQRGEVGKRSPVPQDLSAELAAQELAAQNELQTQTTEEEFAQELNDAAWKAASGVAGDQIQKRQWTGAALEQQQQEDAELAALQAQEAQTEAQEAAAQQNANSAYQQVDSQIASDFSKRSAQ